MDEVEEVSREIIISHLNFYSSHPPSLKNLHGIVYNLTFHIRSTDRLQNEFGVLLPFIENLETVKTNQELTQLIQILKQEIIKNKINLMGWNKIERKAREEKVLAWKIPNITILPPKRRNYYISLGAIVGFTIGMIYWWNGK